MNSATSEVSNLLCHSRPVGYGAVVVILGLATSKMGAYRRGTRNLGVAPIVFPTASSGNHGLTCHFPPVHGIKFSAVPTWRVRERSAVDGDLEIGSDRRPACNCQLPTPQTGCLTTSSKRQHRRTGASALVFILFVLPCIVSYVLTVREAREGGPGEVWMGCGRKRISSC